MVETSRSDCMEVDLGAFSLKKTKRSFLFIFPFFGCPTSVASQVEYDL